MRAIAARTLINVTPKNAFARSSSRNRVSRYSCSVATQRPPIAIRASSVAGRSRSASEIGFANGSAISAATVANQNSAANEVATTFCGSSPPL